MTGLEAQLVKLAVDSNCPPSWLGDELLLLLKQATALGASDAYAVCEALARFGVPVRGQKTGEFVGTVRDPHIADAIAARAREVIRKKQV